MFENMHDVPCFNCGRTVNQLSIGAFGQFKCDKCKHDNKVFLMDIGIAYVVPYQEQEDPNNKTA